MGLDLLRVGVRRRFGRLRGLSHDPTSLPRYAMIRCSAVQLCYSGRYQDSMSRCALLIDRLHTS